MAKALLCDSLVCAAWSLTRLPPITAQSSLQSNWNASPGWKTSGTNTPRPVLRCATSCPLCHRRTKAVTRA